MQRIVPFVDHEIGYRLLQKLVAYSDSGCFDIPVVVTTRENGKAWWPCVREICSAVEIPLLIYEEDSAAIDSLSQVDWFLLLSWKHIIPANLMNIPKFAAVNLHYSLLPCHRGVYPVNWAITSGEKKTGFTYHLVTKQIDDGEIFMQVEVPVFLSDTARTLHSRIDDEVVQHFDEFLDRLMTSGLCGHPAETIKIQNSKSTYHSREGFERACLIDLEKTYRGAEFFDLLRGLTFFEDSKNGYVIDRESGKRIYVSIKLRVEE